MTGVVGVETRNLFTENIFYFISVIFIKPYLVFLLTMIILQLVNSVDLLYLTFGLDFPTLPSELANGINI